MVVVRVLALDKNNVFTRSNLGRQFVGYSNHAQEMLGESLAGYSYFKASPVGEPIHSIILEFLDTECSAKGVD